MSEDNREQQGGALLEAKDVRVYLPPSWLTRSFVYRILIFVFVLGPIPTVLLITGADQIIRNKIDEWMSAPDLYESLALRPEEYARLPVHWRQTLAEIAVRAEPEIAEVQGLIETLTFEHIQLVDKVAPHKVEGFIVRDDNNTTRHPMPTLSVTDFDTLEDLGILQSVHTGHEVTFDMGGSANFSKNLLGATVALVMRGTQENNQVKVSVTRFTELGIGLIDLLRVPSDIRYFEWLAQKVENLEVSVELWAIGTDEVYDDRFASVGRVQRDSISDWPGED